MNISETDHLSFSLSDAQIARYQSDGYLILHSVLDDDSIQSILQECMIAWNAEKGEFDPEATWLRNSLLPNVHHHSEAVRQFYFNGPFVDIAQQLIGPNIKGATSQLTFKMRGNTMQFGWHQDNGYGQLEPANSLTTLTALDDTDEENGCLWILPGSHQDGQIDVSDRQSLANKNAGVDMSVEVGDERNAIPVPLKSGDAVIFHCHTLHRSDANRSTTRDRRILFMRFADANAVEVYNSQRPRLGPLLRGRSHFDEVTEFERDLVSSSRKPS